MNEAHCAGIFSQQRADQNNRRKNSPRNPRRGVRLLTLAEREGEQPTTDGMPRFQLQGVKGSAPLVAGIATKSSQPLADAATLAQQPAAGLNVFSLPRL